MRVPLFRWQHRLHRWTSRALLLPGEDELGDILEGHLRQRTDEEFRPLSCGCGANAGDAAALVSSHRTFRNSKVD